LQGNAFGNTFPWQLNQMIIATTEELLEAEATSEKPAVERDQ
jgi:hypothetical protein